MIDRERARQTYRDGKLTDDPIALIEQAIKDERERCASLADDHPHVAEAIREQS